MKYLLHGTLCLILNLSLNLNLYSQQWKMAEAPLSTSWAEKINPENVHADSGKSIRIELFSPEKRKHAAQAMYTTGEKL